MTSTVYWLLAGLLLGCGRRSTVSTSGPATIRSRADSATPLLLDLIAAALRAGRPVPDAVELAATAMDGRVEPLLRVARLLRLGAEPRHAWSELEDQSHLAPIVAVAIRSSASGFKLAAAFERLAAELRADRLATSAARAQRAGVLAMLPLAACFLPAFVCLGVVPTVVGVATTVLQQPH